MLRLVFMRFVLVNGLFVGRSLIDVVEGKRVQSGKSFLATRYQVGDSAARCVETSRHDFLIESGVALK